MFDISINRVVHLARRDKLYMRARRVLRGPFSGQPLAKREKLLETLMDLLGEAESEAASALRGRTGGASAQSMLKFLELLCDAAEAAYAMVRHEGLMEEDKNFLKVFMGSEARGVMKTEASYRRSADEIMDGVRVMVAAVDEAYRRLRVSERSSCSRGERERYRRAYKAA